MIKVAMVDPNGEVAYTISPAVDDMYVDGQTYNGCVARHISHESDDQEVIATWVWTDDWQTRESQPSVYHEWLESAWVFSASLFWQDVRGSRDIKLSGCDWTQMPDSALSSPKRAEWTAYRQALRDIPQQFSADSDEEFVSSYEDESLFPTAPN